MNAIKNSGSQIISPLRKKKSMLPNQGDRKWLRPQYSIIYTASWSDCQVYGKMYLVPYAVAQANIC